MFLADNKTFSLGMISGLEAYAINKAHESKRYKVENSVNPKYEIDEYDLPLIEEVYEEIQFIMATQGYKMDNAKSSLNDEKVLHTTSNGIKALGIYNGEKFDILDGSEINMTKEVNLKKYNVQRKELLENGGIILSHDSKYLLTTTIVFNSPSGASDFVLGGSTNGWVEWKDKDGKTLDELYRK